MKLICAVLVTVCVGVTLANQNYGEGLQNLQNYINTLPEEEQSELIQGIVDNVVENLVEEGNKEKLSELFGAMEAAQKDDLLTKRQSAASEKAYLENLKRGHCCLGGELVVSYATTSVVVPVVHSVNHNTNTQHTGCSWWRRCVASSSKNHQVAYTNQKVDLKVPRFSCHEDRAVCCHGYIELKKIPGDMAKIGEGNCIKSSQALFTIIQLQLLERVSEGRIMLTEPQMDRLFGTIDKFFTTNGIAPEDQ